MSRQYSQRSLANYSLQPSGRLQTMTWNVCKHLSLSKRTPPLGPNEFIIKSWTWKRCFSVVHHVNEEWELCYFALSLFQQCMLHTSSVRLFGHLLSMSNNSSFLTLWLCVEAMGSLNTFHNLSLLNPQCVAYLRPLKTPLLQSPLTVLGCEWCAGLEPALPKTPVLGRCAAWGRVLICIRKKKSSLSGRVGLACWHAYTCRIHLGYFCL